MVIGVLDYRGASEMNVIPFSLLKKISEMRNEPQMHNWPEKRNGRYPHHSVDKVISSLNVNDFMIAPTRYNRMLFLNMMRIVHGEGCAKTYWVESKQHFMCIRKK